ncbi:MAG: DUF983 domain-containing protein [Planctomycetes bacterium]|nr:DUF983 domain-containing protein [Planctomycetota bacterium]MCB9904542.1 DUF983 domain-containing protein [Planctomycetota bacterium]
MNEAKQRGGWQTFRVSIPRVLRRRCPQCGDGALFRTRFELQEACADCGLVYRREQGSMTGSMYLCAAVTEIVAAILAVGMFLAGLGLYAGLIVGLLSITIFCFWFLPYSKGIWVAVEYSTDVGNREDWVDPR